MNDTTPTESHIQLPHDACSDTTRIILPGNLSEPVPVTIRDGVPHMTHERVAKMLRTAGYREPDLPPPQRCMAPDCLNYSSGVLCHEHEQIAAEDRKASKTFWGAFSIILLLLGAVIVVAAVKGGWL